MKRQKLLCSCLLLVTMLLCLFASCSGKSSAPEIDYNPSESIGSADASIDKVENAGFASNISQTLPENHKLIKTFRITAETKEFDVALKSLTELIEQNNGYVEKSSVSTRGASRIASVTVRVPSDKAETFVNATGELLNITSSSSDVDDVSETYYSIQARLEELKAQRDSLVKIMESLDTQKDYNFWLTLETRLSSIRQEIAVYQGQLNRYDDKITYSTVYLDLREVLVYEQADTFGTRLKNAFVNGWSGFASGFGEFFIWFVGALPVLLLLGAIIFGIATIIRKAVARNERKRLEQLAKRAEKSAGSTGNDQEKQ